MERNPLETSPVALREDLYSALGRAWAQLAAPGSWLTGAERVSVAAEVRKAWSCGLCKERRSAVSPYAVDGAHDHLDRLPTAWVDVIHRVTTDSGRLTQRWFDKVRKAGIEEDEFVEIVSVTIIATTVDAFSAGIGAEDAPLPTPQPGAPLRRRRKNATPGPGWVSTIAPENAGPELADFYANDRHFNIVRCFTLVPEEAHRFFDLMNTMYLEDPRIHELDGVDRGISRAQIEFLAARCSALLGCYY